MKVSSIKDFFVLDPVGELLCFEEEFKTTNKSVGDRISLISQYDSSFSDLSEVINNLPSPYLVPLLNGLEASIKEDITRRKKEYSLEIKRRQNKSLGSYER
jgi:hypothetical protein